MQTLRPTTINIPFSLRPFLIIAFLACQAGATVNANTVCAATVQTQNFERDVVAYYELGLTLNKSGRYEEAISALEKAITLKPTFAEAYNNLGFSYYQIGNNQRAREVLITAIKLQPNLAVAHSNLGNVYIALGNNKLAIASLQHAVAEGLDDDVTSCSLGVAYYRSRKYKEAKTAFLHAISLNSQYAVAHYNLGVTYLSLKDREMALQQQQLLKTLAPSLGEELFGGIYQNKILSVTH